MKNSTTCTVFAALALIGLIAAGREVFITCLFICICASQICCAIENRGEK